MASKPLEENGIHRAKLWEIAFYALNNTSTNIYLVMVGSISYFLVGIVGIGAVLAGSIITIMRIWDGVTDPFVGMIVDNTNTKIGKNRPFIIIGQIILFVTTFAMFRFIPLIPQGGRFIAFIIIYMIYIVGYTAQCVVTKSAQSCMTNDPEQRPIFSMFDSVYNILLMSMFWPVFLSGTLLPKYTLTSATNADKLADMLAKLPTLEKVVTVGEDGMQTLAGFYNPEMWHFVQLVLGIVSAIFAVCAFIGISRKDNPKYFGTGKVERVTFRDYADVLAHNRGIQMLVVAASSDKLAMSAGTNVTVMMALYGIIFGNYALSGSVSAISGIPTAVLGIVGIGYVARKMGQKTCLVLGTWGALATAGVLAFIIATGHGGKFILPTFSLTNPATYGNLFQGANWSMMGIMFLLMYVLNRGFAQLSGSIVIPMTADCADYEVYRSGRYVPGLMGTLFSFVDKVISSLATTIVALVYATIGYKDALPTEDDPYSVGILVCTLVCFLGLPVIGWILNVVAMKFYPLTKEKMAEIQDEVGRIKAEAMKKA